MADVVNAIRSFLVEQLGQPVSSIDLLAVGGGSINHTYRVTVNKKERFFAKINSRDQFLGMFEKEKSGLELLASRKVIRVPHVVGTFIADDKQVLILEWIEQGLRSNNFWVEFGRQLAALHAVPANEAGLHEDNYMGALPQSNKPSADWISFFIHRRLEPQIKIGLDKRLLQPKHHHQFQRLYQALPSIFPDNTLCLLHGDLWSGNFLCDQSGMPVLIDPAVYFGHPSMDLGMTTLFGGFDALFYNSYQQALPLASNHRLQWDVCNLYPLLIHLNLFGRGYLQSIASIIQDY